LEAWPGWEAVEVARVRNREVEGTRGGVIEGIAGTLVSNVVA